MKTRLRPRNVYILSARIWHIAHSCDEWGLTECGQKIIVQAMAGNLSGEFVVCDECEQAVEEVYLKSDSILMEALNGTKTTYY